MKEYNKQAIYKNFNRKNKWFGIIDYKSLVILLVYIFCIITILKFINLNMEYSIYIFLFFTIPVISAVFININNEVAIDVIIIIIKFYFKKLVFVNIKDKKYYKNNIYKKVD